MTRWNCKVCHKKMKIGSEYCSNTCYKKWKHEVIFIDVPWYIPSDEGSYYIGNSLTFIK